MLTQVSTITEYSDVIMPEVDLVNVRKLVDNLVNCEKAGQMSFDDVANLSALLPDASRSLGIESHLTYDGSVENLKLAHEALSRGMKITLVAVITAAIALILRFFKIKRMKDFKNGGPDNTERGTMSAALAYRKEFTKTAPVMNKQIDEFRAHMQYYANDVGLETLDGDVYPGLLSLVNSVKNYTEHFTMRMIPEFDRQRDKGRMGEMLNIYADLLAPGNIGWKNIAPYNYFFMTDKDIYPHTRFLEDMFRFLKQNHSFETTIPELTIQLGSMRFQPTRQADFELPESATVINMIHNIIENNFSPVDMARAVGVDVIDGNNFDTFLNINEEFQQHVKALFGTNIYKNNGPHAKDEFVKRRIQDYYEFLTSDIKNEVGSTWLSIQEMVDQCADVLKIAETTMTNGKKVNFLAEAKRFTEKLKYKYDDDMWGSDKNMGRYSSQEAENFYELKSIGTFITALVRFVAEHARIVEYTTQLEAKLDTLERSMVEFSKILLKVNAELRKIKE